MKIDRVENEKKTLLDLVDFRDKNVLEIGCGYGRLTKYYISYVKSVLCIDIDEEIIEEAKKSLIGADFYVGNFLNEKFQQRYNIVIFSMSLHHFNRESDQALKKAYELLSENGILLVIEPIAGSPLNCFISIFDDEIADINFAYKNVKRYPIAEETKVAIKWEFDSLRGLLQYFKLKYRLRDFNESQHLAINNLVETKCSKNFEVFDYIRFVLIRK